MDVPTTLKRYLAIITCLVLVAGPVTFARAQSPRECATVDRYWMSLPVPEFPEGDQAVTQYAPSFQHIFVTNGTAVLRWRTEGCSWSPVFQLPEAPAEYGYSSSTARITDVVMPKGRTPVVLLLIEETGPESRPHVLRSTDGGATWEPGDAGLPPAGRPKVLRIAPSDPNVAYLGLDLGGGNVELVYASEDGGASWELRSSPAQWAPDADITGLAVDPIEPSDVWAWGNGGLFYSDDGARTFTEIPELAEDVVGPVDVFHARGEPARIAAFRPAQRDFLGSFDGGLTWERYGAPPDVESVAHGDRRESMLIATPYGIYAFHAPSFTFIRLTSPRPGIVDLEGESEPRARFYGRTSSTVEVYFGPASGQILLEPPKSTIDVPVISPPNIPPERDPKLSGGQSRIVLDPGRQRTLRYVLALPQARTPLDVYFLVDTSDSMTYTIQGLVNGMAAIIDDLHAAGIDVQFGVGEYRAYPDSLVPRQNEPNFVYRRVRDVEPFSSTLQEALESLQADAGGRFESHLSALLHTATGAGEDVYPPGPSERDVPPGQQANFRAKALRVVIHATDSEFGREEDERSGSVSDFGRIDVPELPTFQEVIEAFNQRDILHAGLAVGGGSRESPYATSADGFPTAIGDLRRMASATDTLAPAPLDCNGDGIADLGTGSPLVCALTNRNLTEGALVPAIVNLVKAIRSYQEVSLEVRRGDGRVEDIEPSTYPAVAIQAESQLAFSVTYSCPRLRHRSAQEVRLAARTPESTLAEVTTTVVCRPEREPFFAGPLFAPLLPLLIPPALPPLPPLTEIATTAQSQAQAQFGFASQKQEQPQLAYVQAQTGKGLAVAEELSEDHAMSSLERERDGIPPERTLAAGALVMGMAYAGLMLAREKALRVQRVRR